MQLTTKLRLLGGVAVLATACYGDTINPVGTAALFQAAVPGTNDSILWSQFGSDATTIVHSFSGNTVGAKPFTGSYAGTTGLVSVACPHAPQCSWGPVTNVPAGDTLNWAFDPNGNGGNGAGTGAITLNIPTGFGAGAIFSADEQGAVFNAHLELFNGINDLGGVSVASDANGDGIFIGALDATGANVTKVVFSLTSIVGGGDVGDFAIDTVLLKNPTVTTGSPEPASLFLAGGALLALGLKRIRRAGQNS
jgi:hypothetical protein